MLSVGLEDEERQRSDASTKGIEKKVDDGRKAPATTGANKSTGNRLQGIEKKVDDGRKAPATTGANKSTGNRRAAAGRRYMTIFAFMLIIALSTLLLFLLVG